MGEGGGFGENSWMKGKYLLLPLESEPVENKDFGGQEEARDFTSVQGYTQEVEGASPVHRRAGDVEGKPSDGSIHEDSEIVS